MAPSAVRVTPRDVYGLTLTCSAGAAEAYARALDHLLTVETGAEEALGDAVALDPGFALAHAVLATVLAARSAPPSEVRAHLHAARGAAHGAGEREASFVAAAVLRCRDGLSGDAALVRHVRRWPTDAYAVSLVAPSIASAGVGAGVVEVWPLLDELAGHYHGDWWMTGLRAFARTEEGRWDEAERLAEAALTARPSSGHAGHALAHVLYETGRHEGAVGWLDGWLGSDGAQQRYRSHFSWHAALHELALGDVRAVRRRFDHELASVGVAAGEAGWAPESPFVAWQAAALAGVCADLDRLDALEGHARRAAERAATTTGADGWTMVGTVCRAVRAALGADHALAAALLGALGDTTPIGGSPAQRELLDDMALRSLVAAGEHDAAADVAARRLLRRANAFDRRLCAGRS
jgi:hypothetical protein